MAFCIATSLLVVSYNHYVRPLFGWPLVTLPGDIFTLTASSLGLLIVFRTNGAYGRYDEARKFWGDSLNRSRDLARQACWIKDPSQRKAMWRLTKVFGVLLKCHLRKPDRHDIVTEAQQYLSVVEVQEMNSVAIPAPLWCLNRLA